jgi:hypothetical protein
MPVLLGAKSIQQGQEDCDAMVITRFLKYLEAEKNVRFNVSAMRNSVGIPIHIYPRR